MRVFLRNIKGSSVIEKVKSHKFLKIFLTAETLELVNFGAKFEWGDRGRFSGIQNKKPEIELPDNKTSVKRSPAWNEWKL